jgi:hypothetical protein
MKITIPRELTLRSFENLLSSMNRLSAVDRLDVDMRNLIWTEPAGLLPFTSRLKAHMLGGGPVAITHFPASVDACGHLERMNFYEILGLACPHGHPAHPASDRRFIKITEIGSHDLSERVKGKLDDLVTAHVPVGGKLVASFLVACGELVENTKHAYNVAVDAQASKWPQALIQSQFYEAKNSLHICVADNGIGIKRSIGAKDPDTYKDDRIAIDAALVLGMRGGIGTLPGKGLGLAAIRRFMKANKGTFSIRSGEYLAFINPQRRNHKVPAWKGTVVTLEIRTDRDVDISAIIKKLEKGK